LRRSKPSNAAGSAQRGRLLVGARHNLLSLFFCAPDVLNAPGPASCRRNEISGARFAHPQRSHPSALARFAENHWPAGSGCCRKLAFEKVFLQLECRAGSAWRIPRGKPIERDGASLLGESGRAGPSRHNPATLSSCIPPPFHRQARVIRKRACLFLTPEHLERVEADQPGMR